MKRRIMLVLLALGLLLLLSACADKGLPEGTKTADADTQILYNTNTPPASVPQEPPVGVPDLADPADLHNAAMGEEGAFGNLGYEDEAPTPTVNTLFAGATPMPLNPIDMPTPTPRPPLNFSYMPYDFSRLGITFEAPIGWEIDETVENTVTLYQPESMVLDNYRAFLMVEAKNVGSAPSKSEMKNFIIGMLSTLSGGYAEWKPTNTAERTLIGEEGIYADYRGVQVDGTIVRGRVHITCKNKKQIVVHMSCPAGFNEDYTDGLYVQFRKTLKLSQ